MSTPQLPRVDNFSVDRPSMSLPSTGTTSIAGETIFTAPAPMELLPVGKRKRGRPARPGSATKSDVPPPAKRCKEEEDVCFICFDGGNLVLCDRRDCPKAYHPACIKRDESFFTPRLRWNCGWHLCNSCQKNAVFMCYTCPYSLCKACVRQADISCVRGNKGFCRACMNTIMLLENVSQENKEVATVDFDDTSSWEYLFKVYWVCLKQKESLTLDEMSRATNPWKSRILNHIVNPLPEHRNTLPTKTVEIGSTTDQLDVYNSSSKRRKTRKQSPQRNNSQVEVVTDKIQDGVVDWASKDLLEFIAHMNNGDTSVLSQFDVQALLLEYIRKNNLRDPHKKCQVICDKRLEVLFGKAQVGHFEMLKLLEYHFKDDSCASGVVNAAATVSSATHIEIEQCSKPAHISTRERKRQARTKLDSVGRQTNLDDYAAINTHNINLIYLRRSLMEKILEDVHKLNEKVVGSIVRIRISDSDLKQEMYRLVRVVGASKAAEPYRVGERTARVMLKILNLGRIEDVMVDAISNQDFTEDECKRLRQIIKCGLVERMTVGEVQDIAIALQEVKLKDTLEAEILKLNCLRDRASEMGHRKQLREYVEKLELLKSPEERQRRIRDTPEVHADPRMDPSCQSDEDSNQSDTTKQVNVDLNITRKYSGSNSSTELISPRRCDTLYNTRTKVLRNAQSHEGSLSSLELEADAARILEELRNRVDPCPTTFNHEAMTLANHPRIADESSVTSSSSESPPSSDNAELEETWHYQDPYGKIQGPFCMLLLRKWNSSSYFPSDLRVWRTNESQDRSVLLTDALSKQFHNEHDIPSKVCLESWKARLVSESRNIDMNAVWTKDKPNEGCDSDLTDASCVDIKPSISVLNNREEAALDSISGLPCKENQNRPSVLSSAASSDTCVTVDHNNKPECSDLPSSIPKVDKKDSECDLAVETGQWPSTSNLTGQIAGSNWDLNCTAPNFPDLQKSEPDREGLDRQNSESKVDINIEVEAEESKCLVSHCNAATDRNEISNVVSHAQALEYENAKSHVTEIKPRQDPGLSLNDDCSINVFSTPVSLENRDDKGVEGPTAEHCVASNSAATSIMEGMLQELDSGIGSCVSVKLEDVACEQVTTTQASCQITDSSCIVPDWNTCSWFDGPIELCTLGDESVSDLLSEVAAFESMHGVASPNALLNFGDNLIGSPIHDCFSPFMGYAWSPNSDIQFQSQAVTGEHDAQFAMDLHNCLTDPIDLHSSLPDVASGQ